MIELKAISLFVHVRACLCFDLKKKTFISILKCLTFARLWRGKQQQLVIPDCYIFLIRCQLSTQNEINSMEKKMRNVSLTTLWVEHLKKNRWHLKFRLRYFRWSYCDMNKKKKEFKWPSLTRQMLIFICILTTKWIFESLQAPHAREWLKETTK